MLKERYTIISNRSVGIALVVAISLNRVVIATWRLYGTKELLIKYKRRLFHRNEVLFTQ
jgi:hypothetical protein